MRSWLKKTLLILWLAMVFFCAIGAIAQFGHDRYRDGQIDALSGKPAYELRANERGETVWMEVKQ